MKSPILIFFLLAGSFGLAAPVKPSAPKVARKSILHRASFTESWTRYPSPDVIIKTLHQQFSFANLTSITENCRSLTAQNRALLGDSDALTGRPAIDAPNSSFMNWYFGCLAEYVQRQDEGLTIEVVTVSENTTNSSSKNRSVADYREYFGDLVVNEVAKLGPLDDGKGGVESFRFIVPWSALSPAAQTDLVRHIAEQFAGPEDVILELGLAASEEEFVASLVSELQVFTANPDERYKFLNINKDALSVRDAAKVIQFLVKIQDTLKF